MSDQGKEASDFIPQLDAVLESLAEEVEGWADALGIKVEYSDPAIGESGRHAWAARLREATDWAIRMAISLLTAQGRTALITDLAQRTDVLFAAANAYEQRLEALEDQRRAHAEGIVARYRKAYGDEDPDAARLWRLCRGMKRVWTFGLDASKLETPDEFAEAIDWVWLEEDGAKRKARAEMQRQARELAEHLRVLASTEAQRAVQQPPPAENKPEAKKCGKRGPKRMPLKEAWRYLTVVQEWAGIQQRNEKLPMRDRVRKVQVAEQHEITVRELDAMLGWYAKHRGQKLFPDDPRTLSRDELNQWFE